MTKRIAALAIVCMLCASARAESVAETFAATAPAARTKGLNILVSGMVAPEPDRMPLGLLLGGAYELAIPGNIDLNLGMSFQRFQSVNGPVTFVSVLDATAARRAQTSVFFGAGVGPVFALGNVRPGARMFGGAELFHHGPVPVQVALELIVKFCDDALLRCPAGEKQTWLAGRIGLRL